MQSLLITIIDLYVYILIARVILSWINVDRYNQIVRFIYKVTDPVVEPVRRVIPPVAGIDFSPMIVIFVIYFLRSLLFGN
ncbi:YggT family protein [candidate division KSB1 bacterium]